MKQEIWIFGYGSLIWKPSFPYIKSRPAYVKGFVRRFWQHSTDHRGTEDYPGRVVTLKPVGYCQPLWGMAFLIDLNEKQTILEALDYREKGGYVRMITDLHFECETKTSSGIIYYAEEGNPNWGGPLDEEKIAQRVATAKGPSGHNYEYVLKLAEALRQMGKVDEHVFKIEAHLLKLMPHDHRKNNYE